MIAMLNAMIGRDIQSPIDLPTELPTPRPLPADDAKLIALATDRNPELAQLAHQVAGRQNALDLARMAYIPDINPMAAFTGGVSQMVGAMIVLPTTIPEIRGKIEEERAMLRAEQAMLRQTRSDRAASFVAALYMLRNAERQTQVFQQIIIPRAEQALAGARQSYTTGAGTFMELIDAHRTLLDARQMLLESKVEREKQLAQLEAIAGIDVETLTKGVAQPPSAVSSTSRPQTQPGAAVPRKEGSSK